MYIIHVANKALFENEIKSGAYGSESLKRCGFIHCSDPEWIPNEELKQYAPDGFRREWNG